MASLHASLLEQLAFRLPGEDVRVDVDLVVLASQELQEGEVPVRLELEDHRLRGRRRAVEEVVVFPPFEDDAVVVPPFHEAERTAADHRLAAVAVVVGRGPERRIGGPFGGLAHDVERHDGKGERLQAELRRQQPGEIEAHPVLALRRGPDDEVPRRRPEAHRDPFVAQGFEREHDVVRGPGLAVVPAQLGIQLERDRSQILRRLHVEDHVRVPVVVRRAAVADDEPLEEHPEHRPGGRRAGRKERVERRRLREVVADDRRPDVGPLRLGDRVQLVQRRRIDQRIGRRVVVAAGIDHGKRIAAGAGQKTGRHRQPPRPSVHALRLMSRNGPWSAR